jgi:hypothetical protein
MKVAVMLALVAVCAAPSTLAASNSRGPGPPSVVPFCRSGFTVTLPTTRIVLVRGQTFGDLYQYGVPHPIRHTVAAGWRLDHRDVRGAVQLANELLGIAETVTETGGRQILYFPYLFDFPSRLGDMHPRWYSGMAQARIAGLFARLYEATGDHRWRTRAIETYRSLTRVDPVRRVWHWEGTHRWIDTFSWATPDPVLNGHLYAIVGLHDLWRITGVGETVLRQAIDTLGTQGSRFMAAGGKHEYDLARSGIAGRYYSEIVWEQMQKIGVMAPCLAAAAKTFYDPA